MLDELRRRPREAVAKLTRRQQHIHHVDIAIAMIATGGSYFAARPFWHHLAKGRKP